MIKSEDCITVGSVVKTHGLQGYVVITSDNDLLEQYEEEPIFILLDGAPVPFFITPDGLTVRNTSSYLVKFDYVDTQEEADRLVGCEVMIEKRVLDEEDLQEDDDDEEYDEEGFDESDLIDYEVFSPEEERVGTVVDVADYSGNIVLSIAHVSGKEIMLPLSEEYVKGIDPESEIIVADIPQDIIDLY